MSRHAVFYSRMCSVMGRHVPYFCERFGVCSLDVIDSSKQWKLMADEAICRNDSRAGHAWLGMVYCACLWMTSHITMCLL